MENAVTMSCLHTMTKSLVSQVNRLTLAGYPTPLLRSSAEAVLKWVSSNSATKSLQENARGRLNAIPYIHGVSHTLKKIGDKEGVQTVFSVPNKLAILCTVVNDGKDPRAKCDEAWKKVC